MAEECRHAGCNALIGKPLSGKVLLNTINKVLSHPREFIDGDRYIGPCRRAGIVTAGAPTKRRKADQTTDEGDACKTLRELVDLLRVAADAFAQDVTKIEPCEAALRDVQAYAANAGDGPMIRACAAFALQLASTKGLPLEALKASLDACMDGLDKLVSLGPDAAAQREEIAETVRLAVGKAAMKNAA